MRRTGRKCRHFPQLGPAGRLLQLDAVSEQFHQTDRLAERQMSRAASAAFQKQVVVRSQLKPPDHPFDQRAGIPRQHAEMVAFPIFRPFGEGYLNMTGASVAFRTLQLPVFHNFRMKSVIGLG
ncbi:hypothetical protein D1872_247620 [compost metagenome]